MKIRILWMTLMLLSGNITLQAQSGSYVAADFFNTFLGSRYGKIIESKTEISGSPYEKEEFVTGEIYTGDKKHYIGVPLRYNIYTNQMEFKNPEGGIFEVNKPEIIDSVLIGSSRYIYHAFKAGLKTRDGFFKVLTGGNPALLVKMKVILNRAEPATTYKDAIPAAFERMPDEFYLFFPRGDGDAVRISGKKEFLGTLGSFQAEMEQFIKKDKIRFNKQDDLISLMNYYYSLAK